MSERSGPQNPENAKLIIIRGPSGSGKSTAAREVQRQVADTGQPVGLVDQDYYKETMILPKAPTRDLRMDKMYHDAHFLLDRDCHVIMDGTFDPEEHKPRIDELIEAHSTDNYLFYFNLSLKETLRRHATRAKSAWLSEEDLRGWYRPFTAMGYDFETEFTEEVDQDSVIASIISSSGILRARQRLYTPTSSGSSTPESSDPES